MARPRSKFADYLIYLAARAVVCVAQTLSWPSVLACARFFARAMFRFDRKHREIAADNIRQAFPELDEAGVARLTLASFEHLFQMGAEIVRLPRTLHRSNLFDCVDYATPDQFDRAVAFANDNSRPRLVLTGHFGNWEVFSYAIGLFGLRGSAIARRIDNPYIDRFVRDFRRKTHQEILDKNLDYDKMLGVLERKGILGMVGDQDAGPRGLFVPFMGRPASTYKSIALLSLEYSAPILVVFAARVGSPLKYRLFLEDIIEPAEYAEHPDPVLAITRRYTEAIERVVRRHPEQYFWVHRRWKHQPKEKRKKDAA